MAIDFAEFVLIQCGMVLGRLFHWLFVGKVRFSFGVGISIGKLLKVCLEGTFAKATSKTPLRQWTLEQAQ